MAEPRYWLMKIEPSECSVDDLAKLPGRKVAWTGVRNYQARNFMRDDMRVGDGVLYYHSSCAEPGVAGIAEVASTPFADPLQFKAGDKYFDAKASPDAPRWWCVDVRLKHKLPALLPLTRLREEPALADMRLLQRGNRLSITPVSPKEWRTVLALAGVHEE